MKHKGKIFLLDDEELIASMLTRSLKKEGYNVHMETQTDDVINKIRALDPDIVILDIGMPERDGIDILQEIIHSRIETQVVMLTADDSAETAVRAMKLGASDYLTKPFNTEEVKIVLSKIMEKVNLRQELNFLRDAYSQTFEKDLVGESAAIKQIKEKVEKIAQARVSTVLITGESGTGKEVVAKYLHNLMYGTGTSRQAPFISVNCAAMPESLLESELFGYEKGSFTDAKSDKKGMFELANDGTILLDEIGDMKMELQSKLLRVLENRTIRHIGGQKEVPVNATVIATTNRNLAEAVEIGDFRKDLFFRLSAFYFHIVPLRERKEDIPLLARHFLKHFADKYNKKTIKDFSPEAEQLLIGSMWPGNVRELKNLVERFVVLESTELIQTEHVPKWIFSESIGTNRSASDKFILPETGISLEKLEKDLFLQALDRAGNNKTLAAKLLDISYDTLRYQLKKFGIK
ncbi:MAG: sigma-54 dependent transcriptional regulator [Desulfobacterales bacterium]|nr:sigma-54 dependent transcriptional regulator [Desulfobacterales bacterium]